MYDDKQIVVLISVILKVNSGQVFNKLVAYGLLALYMHMLSFVSYVLNLEEDNLAH